jgi:hypothetical protein
LSPDARHVLSTLASLLALVLLITVASAQDAGVSRDGWVRVEWEVRASTQGRPVMSGYVYNDWVLWIHKVRLRVELLDASGRPIGETFGPVFREIGPGERGYFVLPLPAAAGSYRVTVDSFGVFRGGGG